MSQYNIGLGWELVRGSSFVHTLISLFDVYTFFKEYNLILCIDDPSTFVLGEKFKILVLFFI